MDRCVGSNIIGLGGGRMLDGVGLAKRDKVAFIKEHVAEILPILDDRRAIDEIVNGTDLGQIDDTNIYRTYALNANFVPIRA